MMRREFVGAMAAAGLSCMSAAGAGDGGARAQDGPCILVRSSWQTVNIGDIAHTPGLLRLLELHLPEVRVVLWPCNVDRGVEPMLREAFPWLQIAKGDLDASGKPTTPELRDAFERASILVHGSGPSVVRAKDLAGWHAFTGKPYGIYGVTVGEVTESLRDLLTGAQFVYCRDSLSIDVIRESGARPPVLEFAPDATFAFHLRDEAKATEFLAAHDLADEQFIAAIPRLRYTPYHEIHGTEPTERDLQRAAYSAEHREADHAKLRQAITDVVRATGLKVLACAEMIHEVQVSKEAIVDPLPDDVRAKTVWRDTYWLPDEAASVYARARALASFELHSPIMALAAGTPAMYLRQPTDTIKGHMWRDVGLAPWIFEIEEVTGKQIGQTLLGICEDPQAARERVNQAMDFAKQRQVESLAVLKAAL